MTGSQIPPPCELIRSHGPWPLVVALPDLWPRAGVNVEAPASPAAWAQWKREVVSSNVANLPKGGPHCLLPLDLDHLKEAAHSLNGKLTSSGD